MPDPTLEPDRDYPLSVKHPELLFTSTGKSVTDLTITDRKSVV